MPWADQSTVGDVIKASTDLGNTPTAAAFHRSGYPTVGEETNYELAARG